MIKKAKDYCVFIFLLFIQCFYILLEIYKKICIGEYNLTQKQIKSRLMISIIQTNLLKLLLVTLIIFLIYLLYIRLKNKKLYVKMSKRIMRYFCLILFIVITITYLFDLPVGSAYENMYRITEISFIILFDSFMNAIKNNSRF